jgi:hypothetical protein
MADTTRVINADELARQTYLTSAEAAVYTRKPSRHAFYCWVSRHPQLRQARTTDELGNVLYSRFALDQLLQGKGHRRVATFPSRVKSA